MNSNVSPQYTTLDSKLTLEGDVGYRLHETTTVWLLTCKPSEALACLIISVVHYRFSYAHFLKAMISLIIKRMDGFLLLPPLAS